MATSWRATSALHNCRRKRLRSCSRYWRQRHGVISQPSNSSSGFASILPPAWPVHQPASAVAADSPSALPDDQRSYDVPRMSMEQTLSGNVILIDETYEEEFRQQHTFLHEADLMAANGVLTHFCHSKSTSSHLQKAHILYSLIHHCHLFDDITICDILDAADSVFFNDTLVGRVRWEWSSAQRFHTELVGTTALRECRDAKGGVECLIVLSEPLLKGGDFHRELGVGVFLHELIHAFLFIKCGFTARAQGGHTEGFHIIAEFIDNWVGRGYLRLCNMTANLSYFRKDDGRWEEVVEDDLFKDPAFPVFGREDKHYWSFGPKRVKRGWDE